MIEVSGFTDETLCEIRMDAPVTLFPLARVLRDMPLRIPMWGSLFAWARRHNVAQTFSVGDESHTAILF